MAEPMSSLPVSPQAEPDPQHKPEPIPWPAPVSVHPIVAERESPGEEARAELHRFWEEAQSSFSRAFLRAKTKFRFLRHERPVHIIAGVAAAAFLLGISIRIWRSRYE